MYLHLMLLYALLVVRFLHSLAKNYRIAENILRTFPSEHVHGRSPDTNNIENRKKFTLTHSKYTGAHTAIDCVHTHHTHTWFGNTTMSRTTPVQRTCACICGTHDIRIIHEYNLCYIWFLHSFVCM